MTARWPTIALASSLLLASCQPPSPTPHVTAVLNPFHLLLHAKGSVALRKPAWTAYSPISFGAAIAAEDLVRIGAGASITVACADLSILTLSDSAPAPLPCPDGDALVVHPRELLMRGAVVHDCPALLFPRAGNLRDPRPEIRWAAIEATRDYKVALDAGAFHWERDTQIGPGASEGRLPYPAGEAPLPLDGEAAIVISGALHSSRACSPQRSVVHRLSAQEQAAVERAELRLQTPQLSPTEVEFLRANLWVSHEMYSDAIALLERLARKPGAPREAVERLLGECYEAIELPERAAEAYRAALAESQSQAASDLEAQAALNLGLARVSEQADESRSRMLTASELYRRLGDTKRADDLAHPGS
jgi:hypothetical protein